MIDVSALTIGDFLVRVVIIPTILLILAIKVIPAMIKDYICMIKECWGIKRTLPATKATFQDDAPVYTFVPAPKPSYSVGSPVPRNFNFKLTEASH